MTLAERFAGVLDALRLSRARPELAPRRWQPSESSLAAPYNSYVHTVSSPDHAASLEVSVYLDAVCRALKPKRLLDTGSGFSSYVLRRYAAENGAEVVSADDSPEWLDRTREFLNSNDLSTEGLVTWAEFLSRSWDPFDVVFHDVAGGQVREDGMPVVAKALAPGGCVIFDDAHHTEHRARMHRTVKESDLHAYSLRRWVLDEYGRYAILATR
jgi:predicted O-methyltransferase YrrM